MPSRLHFTLVGDFFLSPNPLHIGSEVNALNHAFEPVPLHRIVDPTFKNLRIAAHMRKKGPHGSRA